MRIISGIYKNRLINTPKGMHTRPTSNKLRGSFFNICQHYTEGALFLDLFAGSGAVGLEALSRGAKKVVFVDSNRECAKCIKDNLLLLDIQEGAEVICNDVFKALEYIKKKGLSFDIIYADPPYEKMENFDGMPGTLSLKILQIIDESDFLREKGMLFVEDTSRVLSQVKDFKSLELVSYREMGKSALIQLKRVS